MRTVHKLAIAASAFSALTLSTALPAMAEPGSASPGVAQVQDAAPNATAPSCVHLTQWASGVRSYARATNNCASSQRVRMIWAWATDGDCTTLPHNYYYTEWRGRQAYVSELRSC